MNTIICWLAVVVAGLFCVATCWLVYHKDKERRK